jgi:hypothetical protein
MHSVKAALATRLASTSPHGSSSGVCSSTPVWVTDDVAELELELFSTSLEASLVCGMTSGLQNVKSEMEAK